MDTKYDFIILGSGLGGLECAYILSKHGYKVLVLEKNGKLGGTLQSFKRFGCHFSTGMHYLGSMDEGQMLHKIFKYLGLLENINYMKMDDDVFELINIAGKEYKIPQGWGNYRRQFLEYFPGQEEVFDKHHQLVKRAIDSQALYTLNHPDENSQTHLMHSSAYEVIKSLTPNVEIQNYLAALNFDYVGEKDKTPFYVHALVSNYFILSSYRIIGESDQLALSMAEFVEKSGGKVLNRNKVIKFLFDGNTLTGVENHKAEQYFADKFISNIHPANTMDLVEEGKIKKVYRKRMKNLSNTISSCILSLKMKDDSFKFMNHNYQHFKQKDVWYPSYYDEKKWPEHFFIHTPPSHENNKCTNCIQVLTAMKYEEVKQWENSTKRNRAPEYHEWKMEKAKKLVALVDEVFPGFADNIEEMDFSTPLSFRDYIGNSDGSMYGRLSDINNVLSYYISHKTKIPNLYLTGQNLNLHGALGVSLSALITCGEFIGLKKLLEEINHV